MTYIFMYYLHFFMYCLLNCPLLIITSTSNKCYKMQEEFYDSIKKKSWKMYAMQVFRTKRNS